MKRDMAIRVDLGDQKNRAFHNYNATIELVFALGGRSRLPAAVKAEPKEKEIIIVSEEAPKVEEKVRDSGS